jgi:DNA-binding MarR family transcriptional regulator
VHRRQDEKDARVVRVHLTEKGDRLVEDLTTAHLAELYNLAESLNSLLEATRREPQRAQA